jgi:hypothetical protein
MLGIEVHRFAQQIDHGTHGFDVGETAARHHDSRRRLALSCLALVAREFQGIDDAVSHEDGIAQRLHLQRMLFEAGRAIEVRHRTERQRQLVVSYIVGTSQTAVPDAHLLLSEVNLLDLGDRETGAPQHFPQRLHNIGDAHVAPESFVEHGRESKVVLARNQHDFDLRRAREPPLKTQRRIGTPKSAAQNQDAFLRC